MLSWAEKAHADPPRVDALQFMPGRIRFGLSIGLASEGRISVEREITNGYCFILPVDPFNVAAYGEPAVYNVGKGAGYGVLPDRARLLPEEAFIRPQFDGVCD